jgi:hypothetical protein
MASEAMNELIRRPRKSSLQLISDGNGKGKFAPVEAEDAGDDVAEKRVVDGSADGGKGREPEPTATDMNRLLRSKWVASAGTIKVDV